jgi:hypothetical protein
LPLKVYTPMVQATPIAIGTGQRDFTLGLAMSDALCVRATQGALRLEEQFTAQDLVVPQSGEFLISGGTLAPVPGPPGSCECNVVEQGAAKANTPAQDADAPAVVQVAPDATKNPEPPVSMPMQGQNNSNMEYSTPARADEIHPAPPPPPKKTPEPSAPPVDQPVWTVVMPPLVYSKDSPAPPPAPSAQTMLLIRESQVQPEWVFSGKVNPPAHSTHEPGPNGAATLGDKPEKKHGFWSHVKQIF